MEASPRTNAGFGFSSATPADIVFGPRLIAPELTQPLGFMSLLEQSRLRAARALTRNVAEHLRGDLSLELWNGEVLPLGRGARDDVRIVVRSPRAVRRLLLRPNLTSLFELYAEDELDLSGANPIEATRRFDHFRSLELARKVDRKLALRCALPFLLSAPTRPAPIGYDKAVDLQFAKGRDDRDRIQFHYDLSNAFYALFLDSQMVYSCGYFEGPEKSLDEAQTTKLDRICRKLRLRPGDRFLDVGSGWGALLLHAASKYGAKCHGVTLSKQQFDYTNSKIVEMGLEDAIKVELRDYRSINSKEGYDKVAQVGMFEHVGLDNHDRHFEHIRNLLRPRGLYLHHSITRWATPDIAKFRQKTRYQKVLSRFIFPGGELDYVGLTATNLERHGFEVHDVEGMREHYKLTLERWLERLYQSREIAAAEIGKTKMRLWLLYLTLCARSFERGTIGVFQTLASKRNVGASGLALARGDLNSVAGSGRIDRSRQDARSRNRPHRGGDRPDFRGSRARPAAGSGPPGPQRPQRDRDDRLETGRQRAARDVPVEPQRDRVDEAMRGVEDQRHRAAPVGHGEGAGGDAFLDDALDFRLHARAVPARAAAILLERLDQQVEKGGVALQLLAVGAMNRHQHVFELVVGGSGAFGRLPQARLDRAKPGRRDLLEQRRLGRKIAIDVGVRHARLLRDADHRRARRAEPAHMSPRDFEDPRFDGFGGRRL